MDPVLTLTELLRSSDERLWKRLREVLVEKRIDPATTTVATSFQDDSRLEFGIVATVDGRVFQYDLSYDERALDQAVLKTWKNLSARWKKSPHAKDIRRALAVASKPAGAVAAPAQPRLPKGSAGGEILLELPHRGGHVLLFWTGTSLSRRASFWFEGRRLTISRRVRQRRNDREHVDEDTGLTEMPASELLDHLPTPPIRLRPLHEVGGLAQLDAFFDPTRHQTDHWVLVASERASGAIYNSSVSFKLTIRIELDLGAMVVRYDEHSDLDDS